MEVFKPDCSSLPQSCSQPPESDAREIKCSCPTVNCKWSEWSDWSATCGPATRQKTVTTERVSEKNISSNLNPQLNRICKNSRIISDMVLCHNQQPSAARGMNNTNFVVVNLLSVWPRHNKHVTIRSKCLRILDSHDKAIGRLDLVVLICCRHIRDIKVF